MSDYEYDDDNDQYDNSGGSLRKQLEATLAKLKKAESETATLKGQIAQSKATEVLTAKGYSPAVARLAIKDGVDLSNEKALDDWLTENGELFVKPEANQQEQQQEQTPAPADSIPEGMESTARHIGSIHAAASPAMVNRMQATLAGIPADATKEQVAETLRAAGL